MSSKITLQAYAKINLTLDIFNKRTDGFHSLASVMQTISLSDTLNLSRREDDEIVFECEGENAEGVPTDETNLVVRAAVLAIEAASESAGEILSRGVSLHLRKSLPSQAGLGGGSSDAAAALLGINSLLMLNLDGKTLHRLAGQLGSDVPFFLMGGTAVARGRGELLSNATDVPPFWLVVVKPEENVSTRWAYEQLDADPERQSHRATKRMEEALKEGDAGRILAWQSNDFELPVFARFPKLAQLHDDLLMARCSAAHLCGSGSAVYGVAENEDNAKKIASLLKTRYPKTYVARTISRAEMNLNGE